MMDGTAPQTFKYKEEYFHTTFLLPEQVSLNFVVSGRQAGKKPNFY